MARDQEEKRLAERRKGDVLLEKEAQARRDREARDKAEIKRAKAGRGALLKATKRREEEAKQRMLNISKVYMTVLCVWVCGGGVFSPLVLSALSIFIALQLQRGTTCGNASFGSSQS